MFFILKCLLYFILFYVIIFICASTLTKIAKNIKKYYIKKQILEEQNNMKSIKKVKTKEDKRIFNKSLGVWEDE